MKPTRPVRGNPVRTSRIKSDWLGPTNYVMNQYAVFLSVSVSALTIYFAGCTQRADVDATRQMEKSFQQAAPEVKQAIEAVNSNIKEGNYLEALKTLAPVVQSRNLTQPQLDAIGLILKQVNDAIAANRSLDSKEMYELRKQMFQAIYNGPRK